MVAVVVAVAVVASSLVFFFLYFSRKSSTNNVTELNSNNRNKQKIYKTLSTRCEIWRRNFTNNAKLTIKLGAKLVFAAFSHTKRERERIQWDWKGESATATTENSSSNNNKTMKRMRRTGGGVRKGKIKRKFCSCGYKIILYLLMHNSTFALAPHI